MKIAICGDIHISKTSSIIKSRGKKYSTRIENCLKSIEWFEKIAKDNGCDMEVFLGDTFDKSVLDDEIITAIKDIKWNKKIMHYFIVGNHESSVNGLEYNSAKALEGDNREVVWEQSASVTLGVVQFHFLPYIIESDRKPLETYLDKNDECSSHIIFSHNDIKGVQMGPVVSKTGFTIDEIEDNCELFINGHLHNGTKVADKIINLGILTGQTLNEDASVYPHYIMILDIDEKTGQFSYTLIENPHAFNFYNIDINIDNDINKLYNLKGNAVVAIKCNIELIDKVKDVLKDLHNIIQYRLTTFRVNKDIKEVDKVEDFSIDYFQKFRDFCVATMGNTEVVNQELSEVLK